MAEEVNGLNEIFSVRPTSGGSGGRGGGPVRPNGRENGAQGRGRRPTPWVNRRAMVRGLCSRLLHKYRSRPAQELGVW